MVAKRVSNNKLDLGQKVSEFYQNEIITFYDTGPRLLILTNLTKHCSFFRLFHTELLSLKKTFASQIASVLQSYLTRTPKESDLDATSTSI